jgi:hypothetical protein
LFPQKQSEESLLAIPSITSGKTEMLLLSNTASKGNLLVYSAEGKMIRGMPVNIVKGANSFMLDLGDLPSGMYMIMIRTADKQLVAKLVRN